MGNNRRTVILNDVDRERIRQISFIRGGFTSISETIRYCIKQIWEQHFDEKTLESFEFKRYLEKGS